MKKEKPAIRILLAGQDAEVTNTISLLLAAAGIGSTQVEIVSNERDARTFIQYGKPFDLVMTKEKLTVHGKEGVAICRASKAKNASTPVIIISDQVETPVEEFRRTCCADACLSLPFVAEDLIHTVRTCLKLQLPVSQTELLTV